MSLLSEIVVLSTVGNSIIQTTLLNPFPLVEAAGLGP